MTAISNHFDIESLLQFCKDMGLRQHEMETPEVQTTFAEEYHRAKNMFKGLEVDAADGACRRPSHG